MLAIKNFLCEGGCGKNITEAQQFNQNGLCDECYTKKKMFTLDEVKQLVKSEVAKAIAELKNEVKSIEVKEIGK